MDYLNIIKERKIIDGKLYKSYFIDLEGKGIGIPSRIYLTHTRNRYFVSVIPNKKKYPDSTRVYLSYHDKVSQEIAFKKCIVILKTLTKNTPRTADGLHSTTVKNPTDDLFQIDVKELPIGVSLNAYVKKGGTRCINFTVCYFNAKEKRFRNKKIYVGTSNTWKERYPQKLQEAITLREETLKLYNALTQVTK